MLSVQKFFLMGKKPLKIMKSPCGVKMRTAAKETNQWTEKNLLRKQNFHYNHNKLIKPLSQTSHNKPTFEGYRESDVD